MITVRRDKTVVIVSITAHVQEVGDHSFGFNRHCATELEAALVAEKLRHELATRTQTCRRAEYDRGWKDAKSKRGEKRKWFRSVINEDAS